MPIILTKPSTVFAITGAAGYFFGQFVVAFDLVKAAINSATAAVQQATPPAVGKVMTMLSLFDCVVPLGLLVTLVGVTVAVEIAFALYGVILRIVKIVTDLVPTGG